MKPEVTKSWGWAVAVDGRDGAVAGAGQRAGAFYDLVQDGVEVETRTDAQDRRVEPRDALAQRLVLLFHFVGTVHWPALAEPGSTSPVNRRASARQRTGIRGSRREAPVAMTECSRVCFAIFDHDNALPLPRQFTTGSRQ